MQALPTHSYLLRQKTFHYQLVKSLRCNRLPAATISYMAHDWHMIGLAYRQVTPSSTNKLAICLKTTLIEPSARFRFFRGRSAL
ncbi:hypothetical protein ACVWVY_008234 [Bradyrhizobium sp. URHC0002]